MRRRGIMTAAFGVAVAIPLAALVSMPLFDEIALNQAFLGGSVIFSGWIATFALRELNAILEREQRSRDILVAFKAEIFDYSESMDDDPDDAGTTAGVQMILDCGDDPEKRFHPLLPRIRPPVVFGSLSSEIHLLPERTIDNVVQFYSMLSDATIFAEDLMSDTFLRGRAHSRAAAVEDYLELRARTKRVASDAIVDLADALQQMRTRRSLGRVFGVVKYGSAR